MVTLFVREFFPLGALVFTAAGSSLIFTVWRAKRSRKCILLTTFTYMSEVPKQQLQSQISSPLFYLKLLWECTQSTLHTNASCSRNLWTLRLKHNVTFDMIGMPCDTLRRLGCMLLCKRSWVLIGSISVGAAKHPQVISRQSSTYAYGWPGILQREVR